MTSPFPKKRLKDFPHNPGIYQMKDDQGFVLYVGKAKDLKKRVSSYFMSKRHDLKTLTLVSQIHDIELIVTETETEALILENQLIKKYKPKYNILLKDDKTYPYIKLTKEPFPRVIVTRKKQSDGATYFGPYPSIGSSKALQRMLLDMFPIRDCKQTISLDKQEKKCLLLDIGKCIGPCVYKDIKPDYDALIEELKLLLSGRDKALIKRLKETMQQHSDAMEYEKAAEVRDKIEKCVQLTERQRVDFNQQTNTQVWAVHDSDDRVYVLIQEVLNGKLLHQYGFFEDKDKLNSVVDLVEQSFLQFSDVQEQAPHEIICQEEFKPLFESWCPNYKRKTIITSPQKGEKKAILETAIKNAKLSLTRLIKDEVEKTKKGDVIGDMQRILRLMKRPESIIGFDISHLQGTNIVASAVCFKDAKPYKSGYRKFNIRSVSGQSNDPESMREVVYRRLRLCEKDSEPYPDLLLIDGGRAQLNFALSALSEKGLLGHIDIISLAKRDEEIYTPYYRDPIRLPKHSHVLHLLQHVRDESHRFALTFQRSKR